MHFVTVFLFPRNNSGGANVRDWGSRWFCVLIFGNHYERVLSIARKWENDVAIFSVEI